MSRYRRVGAQLERLLYMLRALGQDWRSLRHLSFAHGVTERTIRRDIAFLRAHGFAIEQRPPETTDAASVAWRITEWPAKYDLTRVARRRARRAAA